MEKMEVMEKRRGSSRATGKNATRRDVSEGLDIPKSESGKGFGWRWHAWSMVIGQWLSEAEADAQSNSDKLSSAAKRQNECDSAFPSIVEAMRLRVHGGMAALDDPRMNRWMYAMRVMRIRGVSLSKLSMEE